MVMFEFRVPYSQQYTVLRLVGLAGLVTVTVNVSRVSTTVSVRDSIK